MTILELGALGEFLGALAVVATLIYLSIQVRHSRGLLEAQRASMEEGTRLARAAAMDRHNDTVSRWRGRLIQDPEVSSLWHKATTGAELDQVESLRLQNLFIDWLNTFRSNFRHAKAIGEDGLARQAVLTVASDLGKSPLLRKYWEWGRPMNELAASDFVRAVERELEVSARLPEPPR